MQSKRKIIWYPDEWVKWTYRKATTMINILIYDVESSYDGKSDMEIYNKYDFPYTQNKAFYGDSISFGENQFDFQLYEIIRLIQKYGGELFGGGIYVGYYLLANRYSSLIDSDYMDFEYYVLYLNRDKIEKWNIFKLSIFYRQLAKDVAHLIFEYLYYDMIEIKYYQILEGSVSDKSGLYSEANGFLKNPHILHKNVYAIADENLTLGYIRDCEKTSDLRGYRDIRDEYGGKLPAIPPYSAIEIKIE